MNPWLAAGVLDERVRDLRAAGRRAGRRGTAEGSAPGRRRQKTSLAQRAARALTGQRLRPV